MVSVKVDSKRLEIGLDAVGRSIYGVLLDGVRYGAEQAAGQVRRRVFIPRRVNVQDELPGRPLRRSAVSVRHEAGKSTVIIRGHWTQARSAAIRSAGSKFGIELRREGLWVGKRGASRKGYQSREGLQFRSFRSDVRLYAWAHQPERGYQLHRHTVWLGAVDARRWLQADPSLKATRPRLLANIQEETRRRL